MSGPDTYVKVRCRFVGFHRWKDATEKYVYLRHFHRHEFHVTLTKEVKHDNRDIEFCELKDHVFQYCQTHFTENTDYSCEQMASLLLSEFDADSVEVFEDGENGGVAVKAPASMTIKVSDKSPERCEPVPVDKLVRSRPFIGIEAEGPDVGQSTLFLPGKVSIDVAAAAIETALSMKLFNIYYGAGNDRNVQREIIQLIYGYDTQYRQNQIKYWFNRFYLELSPSSDPAALEIFSKRPFHCGKMSVMFYPTVTDRDAANAAAIPSLAKTTYSKWIDAGLIYWQSDTLGHVTSLSSPLFKTDVEI